MEDKSKRFDFPTGYHHVRPENYEQADRLYLPFFDDEDKQLQGFSVVSKGLEPEYMILDELDQLYEIQASVLRNGGYVDYKPKLYQIKQGDVKMALVSKK